jgi:hypothetical protein
MRLRHRLSWALFHLTVCLFVCFVVYRNIFMSILYF